MTDKKLITINLSYYNQPKDTLIRHLNYWKKFKKDVKDKFTFFIIDDCSKVSVKEILSDVDFEDLDIKLYRVKVDLKCNIAGVRNLGASECKTPYLVILDMDTVISPEMATSLVDLANDNIENKQAFKFLRKVLDDPTHKKNNDQHPAVCLIRKKDYWDIGGCEEDLVGSYGFTDPSFWHRARQKKLKVKVDKNIRLLFFPDAEADISRNNKRNCGIHYSKVKSGNWSTDFIRFEWEILKR